MKPKFSYSIESEKLAKAIDIAIESFLKYKPENLNLDQAKFIIESFDRRKGLVIGPSDDELRTSKALKEYENDALTYFQEASGETVEYFWRRIREEDLPYKRVDLIAKILKRGRIVRKTEYEFAKDIIVAAEQEGDLSESDASRLGRMVDEYGISMQRKA